MFRVAMVIWAMAATTLAGIFVLTVLVVPELAAQDAKLILPAALGGAVVAVPVSYVIAAKLMKLTKKP
ncbi:MAG: hypothetical protein H6861_05595 [Rhodospirillales bacterium]|nr:hypothetical protein [Rhodospirillales bacterium]